jgi:thiamine monophosphate kinase
MLQAPLADCQCLDLRSLPQNCFVAAEVNVGGCDIVQALVVALVVVILDEGPDLAFKVAGEWLCCTNRVGDSSRESSVVAGMYEQTHTPDVQDQKLASLQ